MSWRIVYITNVDKLSLNLNSVQILHEGNKFFVNLNEIAMLVLEDYKSIVTTKLLIELATKGIPMLVLGNNSMPVGEYSPISDNVRTSKRISEQCLWDNEIKDKLWYEIMKGKIENQIDTLEKLFFIDKIELLKDNINNMALGDKTNMEGISARIYFKELFGDNFIRFESTVLNFCLNFAYHIVRTVISKEIVARGYIPSLGINHKSQYNLFNFADDLIEVFRPIVDYHVYIISKDLPSNETYRLTKEIKIKLIDIVNKKVIFNNKKYSIINAIPHYISSVINFIDSKGIKELTIPKLYIDNG